jgi:hypothetical protein
MASTASTHIDYELQLDIADGKAHIAILPAPLCFL